MHWQVLEWDGADFILMQSGAYGSTIIQNSILSGSHYSRSLEAMQLLSEAIQCLVYKHFFAQHDPQLYSNALSVLMKPASCHC